MKHGDNFSTGSNNHILVLSIEIKQFTIARKSVSLTCISNTMQPIGVIQVDLS